MHSFEFCDFILYYLLQNVLYIYVYIYMITVVYCFFQIFGPPICLSISQFIYMYTYHLGVNTWGVTWGSFCHHGAGDCNDDGDDDADDDRGGGAQKR